MSCATAFFNRMATALALLPELRDQPERAPARRDALDVVEGVAEGLRPVLPGRPRHVRRDRDGVELEERVIRPGRLLDHDVEAGARDLPRRERLVERGLVHY